MLAIDTNVIVRFLTGDDPDQAGRARALIEAETISVSTTVLLEVEWVLRSAYGFSSVKVHAALAAFAGLANVRLQEPERIAQALAWLARGADFADALHLSSLGAARGFRTFDKRLIKHAAVLGVADVEEP